MIVHCTAVCIALNKELEHSDNGDLVVIEKRPCIVGMV